MKLTKSAAEFFWLSKNLRDRRAKSFLLFMSCDRDAYGCKLGALRSDRFTKIMNDFSQGQAVGVGL
ncbi:MULTISPECIES: hypothetical protein [unclassified Nostoc]|uniref:hypothetical protein n=1 Tax=unclassified Nostoc TaxID=2593658 RepID=UPI00117D7E3A|nr:hypothetical protein [Nostoc sp. 'Peltigera membranacea cyanobiont' 232]